MIEQPSHDLLPVIEKDKNVEIVIPDQLGSTYNPALQLEAAAVRDDVRYRAPAMMAFNQKDFLQAVIGDPRYYKVCKAMFGCGTPLRTRPAPRDSRVALRGVEKDPQGGRL